MKDNNELVKNEKMENQIVPVEEKTTALTVVDQNQNLMTLLEKKRQEEEMMKRIHDELVALREKVIATSDSSEISELSTKMNEISDQLDQMLENNDRDYSLFEDVLVEVEKQIEEIKAKIDENSKAYLDSYERIKALVVEQTAVLNQSLTPEELDKRIEELMQEKLAENAESLSVREELEKQAEELRKLVRKRNRVKKDLEAAKQLGLSAAEYKEITDNFRSRKLAYAIIRQLGLGDILDIPYKERTYEQKRRINAIRKEIIEKLAAEKREHADKSILNIVEALYGVEAEVRLKGKQRILVVKPQTLENIRKNAQKLPEKIKSNENIEVTYQPGEAPEDMKEVMENRGLVDKVTLFRDNNSDKVYVRKAVFERFNKDPIGKEILIDGAACYEIAKADADEIMANQNNETSPYVVEVVDRETDTKDETTETEDYSKDEGDEYIPGTNFKKPRNRGVYETDEEYVEFLKSYYDRIFGPQEATIEREEPKVMTKKDAEIKADSEKEDEAKGDRIVVTEQMIKERLVDAFRKVAEKKALEEAEAAKKEAINNAANEVVDVQTDYSNDESDEYIPGTNFKRPRARGVNESDEEYVEFLKNYYERIFGNKEDKQENRGLTDQIVIYKDLDINDKFYAYKPVFDRFDVEPVNKVEVRLDGIAGYEIDSRDVDDIIAGQDNDLSPYVVDIRNISFSNEEEMESRRGLTEEIVVYRDTENPNRMYVYKPVFDRFDVEPLNNVEVRLDGIAGFEIDSLDVQDIVDGQNNETSPYVVTFRDYEVDKTMGTNPPVVDTEPPVVETSPPVVDTDPPVVDTDPPVVDTDPPVVDDGPSSVDTQPPVVDTKPPVTKTNPPKEEVEVITLFRDLNDNNQVYAPDEVLNKFGIKTLAVPTMIQGKPCHKISRDTDQIINSIAKMNKNPRQEVKYIDVRVKEITKAVPRPHVEEILDKLTDGLDIRAKDCTHYKASNLKIAKGFKEELKSGNYAYNIVHVIPAILKAGIGLFRKLAGKLMLTEKAKEAMSTIEERLSKLTDIELEVLFDEYRGSQLKTDMNNQINPLILDRLRQFGLAKVSKLNDQIKVDYAALFSILGQTKALEERMKKTGKDKGSLENQRKELMSQAAVHVKAIIENRRLADNLLSSGVHGLEEDFKAVASRLSYVGMRFAKTNDFDNDLQHQLGMLGRRLNVALSEDDEEAIVQNFMGLETCYYENTEIRGSLAGKRSVGSKYYSPMAEQFDYRDDPFIRDLFTTVAVTSAAISAINAIRVHQIEVADKQAEIDAVNAQNDATIAQVRQTGQEIAGKRDTFRQGMEAQAQQDILTNANTRERAHLDLTNWTFNDAYHAADNAGHAAYNQFNIDVTNQINAVTSDYAQGLISQADALQRMAQISNNAQTTLHEVVDSSLAILKPYAASHPQFDLTAVEQSMEYMLAHPTAITDMNQAMIDVTNLADGLGSLEAAHMSALGTLPSDMATTLVCAASAAALAANVSNTMNKTPKKGTYGNEVTDMMDEYVNGREEEQEEAKTNVR